MSHSKDLTAFRVVGPAGTLSPLLHLSRLTDNYESEPKIRYVALAGLQLCWESLINPKFNTGACNCEYYIGGGKGAK